MLSDYIKVSNISTDQMLYTEADLEASMDKIETINFHEEKEVTGIVIFTEIQASLMRILIEEADPDRGSQDWQIMGNSKFSLKIIFHFFCVWNFR